MAPFAVGMFYLIAQRHRLQGLTVPLTKNSMTRLDLRPNQQQAPSDDSSFSH